MLLQPRRHSPPWQPSASGASISLAVCAGAGEPESGEARREDVEEQVDTEGLRQTETLAPVEEAEAPAPVHVAESEAKAPQKGLPEPAAATEPAPEPAQEAKPEPASAPAPEPTPEPAAEPATEPAPAPEQALQPPLPGGKKPGPPGAKKPGPPGLPGGAKKPGPPGAKKPGPPGLPGGGAKKPALPGAKKPGPPGGAKKPGPPGLPGGAKKAGPPLPGGPKKGELPHAHVLCGCARSRRPSRACVWACGVFVQYRGRSVVTQGGVLARVHRTSHETKRQGRTAADEESWRWTATTVGSCAPPPGGLWDAGVFMCVWFIR